MKLIPVARSEKAGIAKRGENGHLYQFVAGRIEGSTAAISIAAAADFFRRFDCGLWTSGHSAVRCPPIFLWAQIGIDGFLIS